MQLTIMYLQYLLFFCAVGSAIAYALYIYHSKTSFNGKLPTKLVGWYHYSEMDGTTSNRKRKYMKLSNVFLGGIWIPIALCIFLLILSLMMHH